MSYPAYVAVPSPPPGDSPAARVGNAMRTTWLLATAGVAALAFFAFGEPARRAAINGIGAGGLVAGWFLLPSLWYGALSAMASVGVLFEDPKREAWGGLVQGLVLVSLSLGVIGTSVWLLADRRLGT